MSKYPKADCAYFPEEKTLVAVNLTMKDLETQITLPDGICLLNIPAGGQCIIKQAGSVLSE